jgi:hypothetical protein
LTQGLVVLVLVLVLVRLRVWELEAFQQVWVPLAQAVVPRAWLVRWLAQLLLPMAHWQVLQRLTVRRF